MLGRLQSFSLKSFLVRDFSCPSCDNSACVVPLSFIYTLLLFNSVFPFLFSRSSRSFFSSTSYYQHFKRLFSLFYNVGSMERWSRRRIIWSRFFLARNFSPDSSFPNFDSRKTSSLSQFIGFARRDRSKNRQINSLPINRLLSNDQLSPVLLFLPPYSTPLSSSNEAETLEPVPLHSHPSIHPFIPRREIEK